ncbi:MAG: hypothetical protein ACI841_004700, partial [Planctomycetota bacterium]
AGQPALGNPNTPKNWGETSWLVKGSGGMVSTVYHLQRWLLAMRSGAHGDQWLVNLRGAASR